MAEPRRSSGSLAAAWRVVLGRPLRSSEMAKERITPFEGLSALSLDALTSVAYGPEAIIVVVAVAGSGALHLVLPITLVIVGLLAILVFSYRQVIDAYPGGGGAYAVSRANLGAGMSLIAGASLVVDYTLTVAVSIAAGVGALTSAFPSLTSATVPICLGILAVVTVLNLRGLGETARAFLLPTMVFIVGLLAIIAVGFLHPLALHVAQPGRSLLPSHAVETVSILLVLKAFSAGCSALTGVEAIANGVPLFKEPRAVRAKRTELLLGVILGTMLLGLAELARRWHIGPRSGQTVLSQIMGMAVGRHWAYYIVSLTITPVLALAANTSFGGLPVLASLLARDNYLPHLFALRGDRQVFANGIWALALFAGVLLAIARGNTNSLIPLFAIGVFTGFTLAQIGLVVHWWRTRPARWRYRSAINGFGAAVTAVATVVFLLTKFTEGAWVVVVAVPAFVLLFRRVRAYYARTAIELGLGTRPVKPTAKASVVIVPVSSISRLTSSALCEALSLSSEVIAVTVAPAEEDDPDARSVALLKAWEDWDPGVPLRVLHTEYASVVEPIVAFVDDLRSQRDEQIVVLIPVTVPRHARYRLLHNQIDLVLSAALRSRDDVVVARVGLAVGGTRPPGPVLPEPPGVEPPSSGRPERPEGPEPLGVEPPSSGQAEGPEGPEPPPAPTPSQGSTPAGGSIAGPSPAGPAGG
jgi:amino acid transporter